MGKMNTKLTKPERTVWDRDTPLLDIESAVSSMQSYKSPGCDLVTSKGIYL